MNGNNFNFVQLICFILMALCCLLAGCEKTYNASELAEMARKEVKTSQSESIELTYAGMSGIDNQAIIWYIYENEHQTLDYLPLEVEIAGIDTYKFIRSYKPMIFSDIAILKWENAYTFIVNNSRCKTIELEDEQGKKTILTIEKDVIPYVDIYQGSIHQFRFLDEKGNEIQ